MGNQKTVVIGEEAPIIGGPVASHHAKKEKEEKKKAKARIVEEQKTEINEKTGEQPNIEAEVPEPQPKKKEKIGKAKVRSKNYQRAISLIDRTKKYDLSEAIELVKKTTLTKFDGNIEVHVRLLSKSGKPENVRGFLKYPHPTGKKISVVILDEKKAEEIAKTGKVDFDIALATPEMMPKIAKLAKILGPKGKMPNPKSGTITNDPEKTKSDLESGQAEYKTDSQGNLHQVIGKVSADSKILSENFQSFLSVLPIEKIDSLTICATMGPGVKIQL